MTRADAFLFARQNLPEPLSQHLRRTISAMARALSGNWLTARLDQEAKKRVLAAFADMPHGRLHMYLPDGAVYRFGTDNSQVAAQLMVRHPQGFFRKVILSGHIGVAEAYMRGDWDTDDLEAVFAWAIANAETSPLLENASRLFGIRRLNALGLLNRWRHRLRANTLGNSRRNIQAHYDLSNDFFRLFLDDTMTYSSALFDAPNQSLEDAQIAKYDALCRAVRLQPGGRVLEIGTGWGGFALHAARYYDCRVVTLTLSQAQRQVALARIADAGLSDHIEVRLQDYRQLDPAVDGLFDQVVSIEMIEAVGDAYYAAYFGQCARMLKPDGLLGLQMIICPDSRFEILKAHVDFIQKHVFPGSLIPSLARLTEAMRQSSDLSLHQLNDMGLHYARTLGLWRDRFEQRLDEVRALGFDDWFIRKWRYYLLYCKAAFATRHLSTVQAVYTRPNNPRLITALWLKEGFAC